MDEQRTRDQWMIFPVGWMIVKASGAPFADIVLRFILRHVIRSSYDKS